MWEEMEISVEKAEPGQLQEKPDFTNLAFGRYFTDYMFQMVWNREKGWHDARICPFHTFNLSPAALVLHYGQAIFEGMKAYKSDDGQLLLFRPEKNFERMNNSALRMCMPRFPVDQVVKALKALIYLERDWVPAIDGASLYLRPTMIATQPALGVQPSTEYLFYIILTPAGPYYAEGFGPTRIYVSDEYVRAAKGGVGMVKTAGNYAASLFMSEIAKKEGYTQVLWLDAREKKYIEEVGTSNIFFKFENELVTPALTGSILEGITRDSVIQLAQGWDVPVVERDLSIDEVIAGAESGALQEVFGTGTAAVISPVGELFYKDKVYTVADGKAGAFSVRLHQELQGIQRGRIEDPFGWTVRFG